MARRTVLASGSVLGSWSLGSDEVEMHPLAFPLRSLLPACCLVICAFFPAVVSAQSAISGLVRDTSGAVMPGVTVEAASPVLIEKVRSAVTDDQGRYTIIDLRPGVYTRHVHAARVQHLQAGRARAAGELHRDGERRDAGRRARGIGHGHRRRAGRRRAEHATAASC